MTYPSDFVNDELAPSLTLAEAQMLHCYTCGHDNTYELRELEETITAGQNTLILTVSAAVCGYCGAKVYDAYNAHLLTDARAKLEHGVIDSFEAVGVTYRSLR